MQRFSDSAIVHEGRFTLSTGRSMAATIAIMAAMFAVAVPVVALGREISMARAGIYALAGFTLMLALAGLLARRRVRITRDAVLVRGSLRTRVIPRAQIAHVVLIEALATPFTRGYIGLLDASGSRLWGSQTPNWRKDTQQALLHTGATQEWVTEPLSIGQAAAIWPGLLPASWVRQGRAIALWSLVLVAGCTAVALLAAWLVP